MIKNEIRALLHNKLLLFVLVVITLIPAMYAGLFLASMWDPYGDLEYLPVAVVNKDKPVTYKEKELKVGQELAEELKDNDSMAFNVVDEETAKTGLDNGTYYMVITIPENFSANASTLMDENPKQMVLNYETNPGKNYISMKLGESAMKEIKANLMEQVTRTYTEEVFNSLVDVEDGFGEAVDGTDEMMDGEKDLADGNKKITDNLNVLADSSITFKEGSETLKKGIKTYTQGVSKVDKGLTSLDAGVKKVSDEAVSGAKQLADGAKTLNDGVSSYTSGVTAAKQGSDRLTANNNALTSGIDTLSAGVNQLRTTGTSVMLAGLQQMSATLAGGLTEEKVAGINALADTALPKISQGIENLNGAVNGEASPLNGLVTQMTALKGALNQASGLASSATGHIASANEILSNPGMSSDEKVAALQQLLPAVAAEIGGVSQYVDGANGGLNTDQIGGSVAALQNGVKDLNDARGYLSTTSDTLHTMLGSLQTIQTTVDTRLVPGMQTIDQSVGTIQTSVDGSLKTGIASYTAGVSQVSAGLAQLEANNKKLTEGASTLASGSSTLATGLSTGVNQMADGVTQLKDGSSQLVANNETLLDGAGKLSDGATKISAGAKKLSDGSAELGDGLNKLKDGTLELHDALADGKEEIRDNEASDDNIDMFVAPVKVEETKVTEVENNGHAMAAYMFSVGLWVACLAFCLMYPLARYTGELTNGRDWWASKAVVLYPMGALMVIFLLLIMKATLGFSPASWTKTLIVSVAAVSAFMAIMYFFNLLLGKVGSFLMLLFMVLQLAGSAGTYPVEISGSLAQALHKWVPFTYSVDGFRAAIATNGPSIVPETVVLFGISIVFTLLTILVFRVRTKRTKENKPFIYEWIEEKGLA